MALTWPGTLPQKPLRGWVEQLPGGRIRTPMEHGPPKMRRTSTAAPGNIDMVVAMDATQVGTLRTFYVTTTAQGVDPWDWIHPVDDSAQVYQFREPPVIPSRPDAHGRYPVQLKLELVAAVTP